MSRPQGRIARIVKRLETLGMMPASKEKTAMATNTETGAAESAALPATLAAVPPGLIVDADVRETLRAGGEPFGEIMAARRALQPGGVLRVRAIFEPVPLYAVLGSQGLDHWTERLADDDWRVWFFAGQAEARPEPAVTGDSAAFETPAEDDVVVLDVRGLEPPEPMVHTLAALETLPAGKTLVQLNVREPKFLLPMLEERGFSYEVRVQDEHLVRTFIRRA